MRGKRLSLRKRMRGILDRRRLRTRCVDAELIYNRRCDHKVDGARMAHERLFMRSVGRWCGLRYALISRPRIRSHMVLAKCW